MQMIQELLGILVAAELNRLATVQYGIAYSRRTRRGL